MTHSWSRLRAGSLSDTGELKTSYKYEDGDYPYEAIRSDWLQISRMCIVVTDNTWSCQAPRTHRPPPSPLTEGSGRNEVLLGSGHMRVEVRTEADFVCEPVHHIDTRVIVMLQMGLFFWLAE